MYLGVWTPVHPPRRTAVVVSPPSPVFRVENPRGPHLRFLGPKISAFCSLASVGARTLLGAPGITTSSILTTTNTKLLGAPVGLTTRSKDTPRSLGSLLFVKARGRRPHAVRRWIEAGGSENPRRSPSKARRFPTARGGSCPAVRSWGVQLGRRDPDSCDLTGQESPATSGFHIPSDWTLVQCLVIPSG